MTAISPSNPTPRRSTLVSDNLPAVLAVLGAALCLSTGWGLFSSRLASRAHRADEMGEDVARIWGGPLLQPHPVVQWRRADAATPELAPGEVASSHIDVDLAASYRRKGLTEYPGYDAKVDALYEFKNPSAGAAQVAFSVGTPNRKEAQLLTDITLQVDGKEQPEDTVYSPDRVVWTGRLEGGQVARFKLSYRARGLERFAYTFAPERAEGGAATAKPVTRFTLTMRVTGARGELDRPAGWMAPTGVNPIPGGEELVWSVDRLLTSFDLGVVLPDNRGLTTALSHLIDNAPWFYLLFGGALVYALHRVGRRARAIHILGLSAGYFLYFPLASYLTAYLPWPAACALSLVGVTFLGTMHALRFIGRAEGAMVGVTHVFFLAVPAAAYLVPAHTGLLLVVSAFVALGAGLQVVGTLAGKVREDEPSSPLPVAGVAVGAS
jgi:hypothetical protein